MPTLPPHALLALPLLLSPATAQDLAPSHGAEWIWLPQEAADRQPAWFRTEVDLSGVEQATLFGTCDNFMEVYLGGQVVATSDEWTTPVKVDVTDAARAIDGPTTLAVWCRNEAGAAGLWIELVTKKSGRLRRFVTDDSWRVSDTEVDGWQDPELEDSAWEQARSLGDLGIQPWGAPPDTYVDGRPSRALDASEIELPEGFEAELLYSVPKSLQGSWVSLTFDPQGRLIASDQYGGLYRVTLTEGAAPEVERLDIELGRAHGLLCAFDALYAVVAQNGEPATGLYRARDTDGDDQYDEVELLRPLPGSGEHGPHALRVGPRGKSLYIIAGNHTKLPDYVERSRVPRNWGEDQLLPRLDDPNGHAVGVMAPAGWLAKLDPDGRDWELVSCGMRNAYDFDFNEEGEVFTFDSDMEWDVGLPWYRPTRVLHLTSGSDFGWRHGSGKWPEHYPDSLPTACDIGLSSPTGVEFGYRTSFPEPYRSAFFIADWSYGILHAVHLEPRGASYVGTSEIFARAKPLPLTDVAVGPDGALYFTTGGRRTQSGLYRVRWTGGAVEAAEPQVDAEARALRLKRRTLEKDHGPEAGPDAVKRALQSFAGSDRHVRYAARVALEHQPVEDWQEAALSLKNPEASLPALLALARCAPAHTAPEILQRLQDFDLARFSEERRLEALRVYSVVFARMGRPDAATCERIGASLDALFPAGGVQENRELARLLVYLRTKSAARKIVHLLETAPTREDQIHYALVLSALPSGWTEETQTAYLHWLDAAVATFEGGHSLKKYLERIREAALEHIPEDVAERARAGAPELVLPEPVVLEPASFVRSWRMHDLVPHLGEVAGGRDFEQGRKAYLRARCAECHRIAGDGGSTGPDLTGAGGRFSPRDMLESLLSPSAVISDQYQDVEILTHDEEFFVGRLSSETDETVTLKGLPPQEETYEIAKEDIALRRRHPLSRMPEGLLDVLTKEEVLDLVAYVLAGGAEDAPAFER